MIRIWFMIRPWLDWRTELLKMYLIVLVKSPLIYLLS